MGSEAPEDRLPSDARAWLAAIVEGSDDAIVSKTLEGVISTWNKGAERIFGYTPAEAVGRPVNMLIPRTARTRSRGSWPGSARASGWTTSRPCG